MARSLPPLNPLRVFEVVARTSNLTAAAKELHVTQSAVSRQIAVLEGYLGIELMRRQRQGVVLTQAGRAYAQQVMPAFGSIADATERLLKRSNDRTLRLRTYTTFAAKWLIPRLPEFQRLHPGIEVQIISAVPEVDFERDSADIAIQFGDGRWPDRRVDLLFGDEIEPVCAPGYLAALGAKPRQAPKALLAKRLLVSHYRRTDWDDWLAATGLATAARNAERMRFGSSVLTWQAALDGLGTAIGQTAMLLPEFASGRLIRPFNRPVRGDKSYYLVRPGAHRNEPRKVVSFRNWILSAASGPGIST